MAMAKRFKVSHDEVFPFGAFLMGEVEQVFDFEKSSKDTKVQKVDKDSGLPMWQVTVADPDPEAGKKAKTVTVKLAGKVQPVPPSNGTGMPFTPVVFEGLSALPYIDDNGNFSRIAWSFVAEGMAGVGKASASGAVESKGRAS